MDIANRIASFIQAAPVRVLRTSVKRVPQSQKPLAAKIHKKQPSKAALRQRLKYINLLARNFEKASTPFEERLFYKAIIKAYASLNDSGLIKTRIVRAYLFTHSRKHVAQVLVGYMRRDLIAAIAGDKARDKKAAVSSNGGMPKRKIRRKLKGQESVKLLNLPEDRLPKKKSVLRYVDMIVRKLPNPPDPKPVKLLNLPKN